MLKKDADTVELINQCGSMRKPCRVDPVDGSGPQNLRVWHSWPSQRLRHPYTWAEFQAFYKSTYSKKVGARAQTCASTCSKKFCRRWRHTGNSEMLRMALGERLSGCVFLMAFRCKEHSGDGYRKLFRRPGLKARRPKDI